MSICVTICASGVRSRGGYVALCVIFLRILDMAHVKKKLHRVKDGVTRGIPGQKMLKGGKRPVPFAPIPKPRIISVDPFKGKKK